MTLAAKTQERYSSQLLIELTNPSDETATIVNVTLLGFAETDILADFRSYAGADYDETIAQHVSVATQGVVARLTSWTGETGENATRLEERFIERARALRKRVSVKSNSVLLPTREKSASKPWSDLQRFGGVLPAKPHLHSGVSPDEQ